MPFFSLLWDLTRYRSNVMLINSHVEVRYIKIERGDSSHKQLGGEAPSCFLYVDGTLTIEYRD